MPEIVLALDVDSKKAVEIIDKTSGIIRYFKVGQALFTEAPEVSGIINKAGGKVLLDLKYNDIPSVISLAIEKVAQKYRPFAITLHISGGKKMLASAAQTRDSLPSEIRPVLFGVTVLTSMDTDDLKTLGVDVTGNFNLTTHIIKLAKFAKDNGLNGAVCSGREISGVKNACGKDFLILVPGLTLSAAAQKDQKRTVTVKDAASSGGDYLVVGRSITESSDPLDAAIKVLGEIK